MDRFSNQAVGEIVQDERVLPIHALEVSSTKILTASASRKGADEAAAVLVAHLFAQGDREIPGILYAVNYRLAETQAGGDIVDVYHFDNDSVAFSIADIAGKGTQAAVHAALIKYGLRAYSSLGLTPEKAMRAMDRLFLENLTFENTESFATVFFGVVDPKRRTMTYASAGHEPVVLVHAHGHPEVLAPTCPLIGVFDDQHHLFKQEIVDLLPGSILLLTTDGITEARDATGNFFGVGGLTESISRHRAGSPAHIVDAVLADVEAFAVGLRDDIALLAARFH